MAGYIAYSETADGPWWSVRGDVQSAQICQYLSSTKDNPLTVAECVLAWGQPAVEVPPLSWDEFVSIYK